MDNLAIEIDPAEYVEQIRQGDPAGIETLCQRFYRGIRFLLMRQLGREEAEDRAHDAILIVVQAIRRGELRDPARLRGYIRTVVRRLVATHIGRQVQTRQREAGIESAAEAGDTRANPEVAAAAQERSEIMREFLLGLSVRDREVLTRFYLLEQTKPQICREMGLTETQFRLLKSRAKARFARLVRMEAGMRHPYR